jgi:hypothetical protein
MVMHALLVLLAAWSMVLMKLLHGDACAAVW